MTDHDGAGVTPANDDAAAALGEGGRRALDAERRARREAEQRARQAEARATALERDRLRERIAGETGVPADLLAGETEEELTAHADRLTAWHKPAAGESGTGTNRPPRDRLTANPGETREEPLDFSAIADKID